MEEEQTKTQLNNRLALGIFIFIAFLIVLASIFVRVVSPRLNRPNVTLAGQKINLEVVSNSESMAQGLSGREYLAENEGMLFLFDGYYIPRFWMKDMNFPLDILFIKDGIIASYNKNVQPEIGENLTIYRPKTFINRVLEVNAGFVDKYGLKIGDEVKFKNIVDKNGNKVLEY